ncbi:MAG: glucose-6-phosphate isomerase [Acholeplasmatales bacterium]|nr:glucose-6-phosphate isomerase [Acholeplasmatales bacterium]
MKNYLNFNYDNIKPFLGADFDSCLEESLKSYDVLMSREGLGNDFLGWLDLPSCYDKEEFARIKEAALRVKANSQILVVVGIGGSYLGARSAIEMLKGYFRKNDVEIIFAGNQMSSSYLNEIVAYLRDKEFSINVISKSGTTTEPAIAFRALKKLAEEKYGSEAKNRIFATTDKAKGALHTLAKSEGYEMFTVPDDVGGRFSVLTAVGLLPIACAGIDIDQMMKGASDALALTRNKTKENPALYYAAIRNYLYQKGYDVELLINYEPCLNYFSEWWKQLFGESEGKDHKGIYPSSVSFSTDLHSLGQMIQDGKRHFFETVLKVTKPQSDLEILKDEENLDGLNYLYGHTVDYVNQKACEATRIAHTAGGVPNMLVEVPEISAYSYGYLAYFFEMSCAISAYSLGVNPFNQPGVEAYKKNMFALLDKPGYEDYKKELMKNN